MNRILIIAIVTVLVVILTTVTYYIFDSGIQFFIDLIENQDYDDNVLTEEEKE